MVHSNHRRKHPKSLEPFCGKSVEKKKRKGKASVSTRRKLRTRIGAICAQISRPPFLSDPYVRKGTSAGVRTPLQMGFGLRRGRTASQFGKCGDQIHTKGGRPSSFRSAGSLVHPRCSPKPPLNPAISLELARTRASNLTGGAPLWQVKEGRVQKRGGAATAAQASRMTRRSSSLHRSVCKSTRGRRGNSPTQPLCALQL